jgi:hypothetical protein
MDQVEEFRTVDQDQAQAQSPVPALLQGLLSEYRDRSIRLDALQETVRAQVELATAMAAAAPSSVGVAAAAAATADGDGDGEAAVAALECES